MERLYVNNGNRTYWCPIQFVIVQVINKITRSSDLLITSMTLQTEFERHHVLLPINYNH